MSNYMSISLFKNRILFLSSYAASKIKTQRKIYNSNLEILPFTEYFGLLIFPKLSELKKTNKKKFLNFGIRRFLSFNI